jgi:hypothetical protein
VSAGFCVHTPGVQCDNCRPRYPYYPSYYPPYVQPRPYPGWIPPEAPIPNPVKGWQCPACGCVYAPWVKQCEEDHRPKTMSGDTPTQRGKQQ